MRCLSVRQPHAWLVIHGDKLIENRSWPTKHRGDLVIHAGLSRTDYNELREELGVPELAAAEHFGVLYAVVNVVDCVPVEDVEDQPYASGPWCWLLRDPRPIVPVRFVGKLGLFTIPDDVIELIA
jgi:hypothetical protein